MWRFPMYPCGHWVHVTKSPSTSTCKTPGRGSAEFRSKFGTFVPVTPWRPDRSVRSSWHNCATDGAPAPRILIVHQLAQAQSSSTFPSRPPPYRQYRRYSGTVVTGAPGGGVVAPGTLAVVKVWGSQWSMVSTT